MLSSSVGLSVLEGYGIRSLMPQSTILQLYSDIQNYLWRKTKVLLRNPLTCHKSL